VISVLILVMSYLNNLTKSYPYQWQGELKRDG